MKNITTFDFELLNKFNKIYCLVSGGIDSTYLYELLKERFNERIIPVNCFNPYEQSKTLDKIKRNDLNFIQIKSDLEIKYSQILKESFLKLPESRKMKKYSKKIFGCCYLIKHKSFMNNPIFSDKYAVVISGIKQGDGMQRRLWLKSLKDGKERTKNVKIIDFPTFFHRHKNNQIYCYPFRDFKERELPIAIIDELKEKYPFLNHSGCSICPVLVRFEKRIRKNGTELDKQRLERSIEYAKKLGVYYENINI